MDLSSARFSPLTFVISFFFFSIQKYFVATEADPESTPPDIALSNHLITIGLNQAGIVINNHP